MDATPVDRTAIERLYRERGRELWARIYACCLDADLALDALHEAVVRFASNGHNGAIKDPAAWIVRTATNWARDQKRKQRNAKRTVELPVHKHENDPAKEVDRAEKQAVVREALHELPDSDREVLVLRYYMGWSSQQIAEALATTPAAVDMRLSRARKRLAERLNERGLVDEPEA